MTHSDHLANDGHYLPEVGPWSNKKYELIHNYATIFATAMKNKWDSRVYIDMFAGAGLARIKKTAHIVKTSSLIALGIEDPFDRYIFCDLEKRNIDALKHRVNSFHPAANVTYIQGDSNSSVDKILEAMPKRGTYLSFCVVDPYRMDCLRFSTLEALSQHIYVDFFVLIPVYMDAHRNRERYLNPKNKAVDEFLGCSEWREKWDAKNRNFGLFIAERFGEQMQSLGYYDAGPADMELVTYEPKNMRLYRLAFYSKHKLGSKFWHSAKKSSSRQLSLGI